MNRRGYLALTGVTLCAGLAGCSGNSTEEPTDEPSEETNGETPSADPVSDEEMENAFREALSERGIEIDHLDVTEERIVMDYITTTTTEAELLEEMEVVTFAYTDVVTRGWDVTLAELWILDPDVDDPIEEAIASYVVENEWAFEWQDGEIDDNELMSRVVDSIEPYEQFRNRYGDDDG